MFQRGRRDWPRKSGGCRPEDNRRPGAHHRPRGKGGALPGCVLLMCNTTTPLEDVPAFVELESGGPPPVACQVVGVGRPPSHPTKEGDRREQHLPEDGPPCPA